MSHSVEIRVDDEGRLFLPTPLDRELNLMPGMKLVVDQMSDGSTYLCVEREKPRLIRQGGILVADVEPLESVDDAVSRDREDRIETLLRRLGY